jgi:hypothetical protein
MPIAQKSVWFWLPLPVVPRRLVLSKICGEKTKVSGIFGGKRRRQPAAGEAEKQERQPQQQAVSAPCSQPLPDAQRHLSALVPTHGLSLTGVAILLILLTGLAVAPTVARQGFGHELLPTNDSDADSIGMLRQSLGLHNQATLAGWLTQAFLFLAAASALVVRAIQRNRLDGPTGRYRVWGWLAFVWLAAAFTTAVPLGPAVAAALLTLTATPFGPQGLGWWATCGGTALLLTVPLAIFRLREQLPTALPLGSGLLLWAGATGCLWQAAADTRMLPMANAAWLAGSSLILLAMLMAVRSSLREIHGLCPPATARTKKPEAGKSRAIRQPASDAGATTAPASPAEAEPAHNEAAIDFQEVHEHTDESSENDFSETDAFNGATPRRLSKSERRRLRKLSRRGQAA